MHLTKASDYGLRVLMYVAQHPGRHITIAEVARTHTLSASHLMKVANRLASLGYLATVRGKGGGVMLGRSADLICVGAVVRDLEPMAAVECLATDYLGHCRLWPRCHLAQAMRVAQQEFLRALDRYSIAQISGVAKAPKTDSLVQVLRT